MSTTICHSLVQQPLEERLGDERRKKLSSPLKGRWGDDTTISLPGFEVQVWT